MALSEDDYKQAANELGGVEPAVIKAVVDVESKGAAYLPSGKPTILFEAHIFHRYTKGHFDQSHPDISSPHWSKKLYKGGQAEWDRLLKAIALDTTAALMSASWGAFQIMGFNFAEAGFKTVDLFVEAIRESEQRQLKVFVEFVKSKGLADELQRHDWAGFARIYNGKDYALNRYHLKLQAAYEKFAGKSV